jgi:hypothetical protein
VLILRTSTADRWPLVAKRLGIELGPEVRERRWTHIVDGQIWRGRFDAAIAARH